MTKYNTFILLSLVALLNRSFHANGECTTAQVGSSRSNSKSITIDDGFKCPITVDKANWLDGHNYGDKFSVAQNGDRVMITRIDRNGGWAMNLKFRCCPEVETTRPTTLPNNCTDLKPPEKCKRWATRIDSLHEKFEENCEKSLMKWIEELSEKEVCYNNDMMVMVNTQSSTQMEDLDDEMDPCMNTCPKRKCRRLLKRLNKRFNKLAAKCSMTAGILKKNLMAKKIER